MSKALTSPVKWYLWLVASLVVLLPLYLLRFALAGIPTTAWEICLYVVVATGVAFKQLSVKFFLKNPIRWPLILFILAGTAAIFVAPDVRSALGQWKALVIDSTLFLWLIASVGVSRERLSFLQSGYLLSATAVASHAAFAAAAGLVTADGRALGIYAAQASASPNYLALYLAPAASIASARALRPAINVSQRVIVAFQAMLIFAAVIISGSRAGIGAIVITTFVAATLILIQKYSRHRLVIMAGSTLIFLAGLWAVLPGFLPNFSDQPTEASNRIASSNNIRWDIWRTTVQSIVPQMSVLGVGWDNYQKVFTDQTQSQPNFPEYIAPYALHPHNFFLTTLVTTGWLGLLAWLWIVGRAISASLVVFRDRLPMSMALLAWLIQGLVDTTYYKNDLAPLAWLILVPFLWAVGEEFNSVANRTRTKHDAKAPVSSS